MTYGYTVTNNSDRSAGPARSSTTRSRAFQASRVPIAPGASDDGLLPPTTSVTGTVTNIATATGAFNDPTSTAASDTASATVTGHACTISVTKTPSATDVCNGCDA